MTQEYWIGTLVTSLIGLMSFLAIKLWDYIKNLKDEKEKAEVEAMRDMSKETHQNTLAIVELKTEIRHLAEKLSPIPKLQSDVNSLHAWRRTMTLKDPPKES